MKSSLVIAAALFGLLWWEEKRPLRHKVEPKLSRDVRNLAVAALSALTIRLTEKPLVTRLATKVEEKQRGLVPRLPLSAVSKRILGIVLLDYTHYLWHILTHKVPALWRLHQVHHIDADLTATTALRFHFIEMAVSSFYRAAQVRVIGVDRQTLTLWQTLTLIEILFHHADIDLPHRVEKALSKVLVTPHLHTIHHSTVAEEMSSNWSSGLTLWDWLHGTLRTEPLYGAVQIGVPAYGKRADFRLTHLLVMPFQKQRKSFREDLTEFDRPSLSFVSSF